VEAAVQEPDPQLIAAARRGDLHAFEQLVRRFQGDVWRLSFHLVRDETLADDITQNAFVRVFRFLPRYRGDSKFTTWLFSIARNCALDEIRRSQRLKRTAEALRAEPETPQREVGLALEVREALANLPLELREPVVLIDMFGTPYAEVATILKTPVGTIKSRVHRARALLAEAMKERRERSGDG
jgi:RNA polymerase sigma-70 factor (ECF subfamily)